MSEPTMRGSGRLPRMIALTVLAVILLAGAAWMWIRSVEGPIEPNGPLPRSTFVVGSAPMTTVISLEMARTPEQQRRGLMDRDTVSGDGMAFPMDGRPTSFWMRGTRIPLDIAFVSPKGVVLNVERGEPFDETPIASKGPVGMVIEVRAGRARLFGLKRGALVREDPNAPPGE